MPPNPLEQAAQAARLQSCRAMLRGPREWIVVACRPGPWLLPLVTGWRCGRPARAGRTERGPRACAFSREQGSCGGMVGSAARLRPSQRPSVSEIQPIPRSSRDRRCPSGSGWGKALVSVHRPAWCTHRVRRLARLSARRGNARVKQSRGVLCGESRLGDGGLPPDPRPLTRETSAGTRWKPTFGPRATGARARAEASVPPGFGGMWQTGPQPRPEGSSHPSASWGCHVDTRDGVACGSTFSAAPTGDRMVRGCARGLF